MTHLEEILTVHAAVHPVGTVHRAGFPLDHHYVERCWTQVLGPSSVLLLRRFPELFKESPDPVVPLSELAQSLGIGGVGQHSAIRRTLDRVVQFRFASWATAGELDVYTTVPPLTGRLLERADSTTRAAHDRLLGEHLDVLAMPPTRSDLDVLARHLDVVPAAANGHAVAR